MKYQGIRFYQVGLSFGKLQIIVMAKILFQGGGGRGRLERMGRESHFSEDAFW